MINGNSSPTVVANRIVSNLVTQLGGTASVYCKRGGVCRATSTNPAGLIENNIIAWSTSGIAEGIPGNQTFVIANNCFFANGTINYYGPRSPMGTNNNFVADPLLVENNGLPRLHSASPCIDAGDDSVIDPTAPDLAGSRRLVGSHVDVGAIEFEGPVIRLHTPQWTTGAGFCFELVGPKEKEFVILTSGDFQTWEPVMTNRCGTILITNPPSGLMDRRYFRAVIR